MKPGSTLLLPIIITLMVCSPASAAAVPFIAKPFSPNHPIVEVSQYVESIRSDPNELRAFFLTMPKGGDLHHHLDGAVYPEDTIDIAARHGMYVDPATGQLFLNNTAPGLVPVSSAYSNMTLYASIVDRWSMRDYPENTGTGRFWFFNTFGLIGPVCTYSGEMIAVIRNRAAGENLLYIETIISVPESWAEEEQVGSRVAWDDNLAVMRENLLNAGLRNVSRRNAERIAAWDAQSRELSNPEGKNVTMRYITFALRLSPKKQVYTNLVQAFETANQSPLIAGVNFVGEEDSYYARTDYRLHMQMLEYLHSVYPDVKIALHAGEQTTGLVPPEDLRFHVADAITTAHASRIGHGVDIMYETDSENTLKEMADREIPVEILLTSNDQILHVAGSEHPVSVYMRHHVPVVIGTDDPGVERTDLTEQYVLLATQHPEISYAQIRTINENGIRYSFLPEAEKEALYSRLEGALDRFERTVTSGHDSPA